ncbi:MAG: hypothetical protein IJU95_09835, partial [Treponema sp.]|nr:hypothetical protein [Treponema sp.]
YNNSSALDSRTASIDSKPDGSKKDALDSYGYKTLSLSSGITPSPLIAQKGVYVYIRLSDYNTSSSPDYKAVICTSSSKMTRFESSATVIGLPRRYVNSSYGFDFGKDSSNPLPSSSDSDYYALSATASGSYYVDLYAFTVGKDTSDDSMSYSGAVHLGSVTISTSDNF